MQKILCLIDNLASGGAQRQMVNLAILMHQRGCLIEFLTYGSDSFYQHYLDDAGICVHKLIFSKPVSRIIKICGYLRKSNADVVIAFMETPGFLACLAKALGCKWKLITNELSAKESTFQGARQMIYNWFERFSDLKICNSENARVLWAQHFPQYQSKLRVIYNPVILPEMPPSSHQNVQDSRLHIVVAASYQDLKNPLGVIDALLLLQENERAALRIDWYGRAEVTLGDTRVYDEAVQRIETYGIHDVIALHPATKQIYPIMNSADFIGLFSTVEGLPNAICEAMMMGKLTIMTRVSDYTTLIEGNGILCDPTPESIANAFRKALKLTDEEKRQMSIVAREKAQRLFNKESICEQWLQVIKG